MNVHVVSRKGASGRDELLGIYASEESARCAMYFESKHADLLYSPMSADEMLRVLAPLSYDGDYLPLKMYDAGYRYRITQEPLRD